MTDQQQSNIQQRPQCHQRQAASASQDPSAIPLMQQLLGHSEGFNMTPLGRAVLEENGCPASDQSSRRFAWRQELIDIIDEALDLIGEDVDTPISSLPPSQ